MSFYVNASQEETFQLVIDYFNGRQMKILSSDAPSNIRAEFGSWLALETSGNTKGKIEAKIAKRNSGSYINLNLDFFNYYLVGTIIVVLMVFITLSIYDWLEIPLEWTLPVLLAIPIIAIAGSGYAVSKTRKRFIEEFNMFIQSLASRE